MPKIPSACRFSSEVQQTACGCATNNNDNDM